MPKKKPNDIEDKIYKKLWNREHIVFKEERPVKFVRRMRALACHMAGLSLRQSAIRHGLTEEELSWFKKQFEVNDDTVFKYVEGLFLQSTTTALEIFHQKKDSLTAMQAAVSASMFGEKAMHMRKARENNYKEPEIPITLLQRIDKVLSKVKKPPTLLIEDAEITREEETPQNNDQA